MTTPNTNNFRFTDIEDEFGQTTTRKIGDYVGTWTYGDYDSPLDRGPHGGTSTPTVKENVRFNNFRNRKLNLIVDFYSGGTQIRKNAFNRYNGVVPNTSPTQSGAKIVGPGQNVQLPQNGGGKRVTIQVNQVIGSSSVDPNDVDTKNRVALRTGVSWATGTDLHLNVGEDGWIVGAGGRGGNGGSNGNGGAGLSGTAALGIEWEDTEITVNEEGRIRTGFGGGGGGGGAECTWEKNWRSSVKRKASGGGGGGGAGYPVGEKGAGGTEGGDGYDGTDGTFFVDGSIEMDGGNGGDGGYEGNYEAWAEGGRGGNGGSSGNAAQPGDNGQVGGPEREGEGSQNQGGSAGGKGGAIRKSATTINWTFGAGHVTNNVAGEGKGGDTESPIEIS